MTIDFKEIPSAKGGTPGQDTFELFARDFFEALGFDILEGPNRGSDGGCDIIINEKRPGIMGTSNFKWLVSCKHYAPSDKAVGADNEQNIGDRIKQFSCDGFIGFYSTVPSSSLEDRLKGMSLSYIIFDHEKIEKYLLEEQAAYALIQRYFPKSWEAINSSNFEFSNLLKAYYPLNCDVCGKDLLQDPAAGLFAYVTDKNNGQFVHNAYCACKGTCDDQLEQHYASIGITSWWDLDQLIIPRQYLASIFSLVENHEDPLYKLSDEAYKKTKATYIRLAQLVMRKHTVEEEIRQSLLESI